jgi:hypothetical protein
VARRLRSARAAPCDPTKPTRALRRQAMPQVLRSARCGLPVRCRARSFRRSRSQSGHRGTIVLEQRDGVDGIGMETKHLLGRVARQRPADRGRIEAAGDRALPVGRYRQGPHRPAMAAQLCEGCGGSDRQSDQHSQKRRSASVATWSLGRNRLCHSRRPQRTPGLSRSSPLAWRSSR